MRRIVIHACYLALYLLVKIISYVPFSILYIISDLLYYFAYHIVRYRRKIVRCNLIESFPHKRMEEIREIERNFYHFFVDMVLESCKLLSATPNEMKHRMRFSNIEYANQILDRGRSISLFLGHYGNWEWVSSMGVSLNEHAIKAQVYHKLRNESIDKLMRTMRSRFGHTSVEMHGTARFMNNVSADSRPCIIGFIADQSPRKREVRHFVHFLCHDVPVLTGTEKLTKHYDYEAVFLSMSRIKRGYYVCELSSLHDNPKSLPDFELTKIYYKRLEDEIDVNPSLYLWTHNRFKHARKR